MFRSYYFGLKCCATHVWLIMFISKVFRVWESGHGQTCHLSREYMHQTHVWPYPYTVFFMSKHWQGNFYCEESDHLSTWKSKANWYTSVFRTRSLTIKITESTSASALTAGRKSSEGRTVLRHYDEWIIILSLQWRLMIVEIVSIIYGYRSNTKTPKPLNGSSIRDEADREQGRAVNMTASAHECYVFAAQHCRLQTCHFVWMNSGLKRTTVQQDVLRMRDSQRRSRI